MNRKDQEKLQVWQERLALAENAIAGERERMLRREQQYEGGHTIYAPDGTKAKESLASHVRNVSFEIIETQVDSTIPSPKVTAVREEDEWLADVIEAMLRDVMDRLPSERMNDEGERLSPVQGGYGLLVDWLDSVSGKDWLGDLKVSLVHPYGIVPQAGMTQVADMDFFFLKTPQTKRQIRKFYGVDVNDENESDPDARRLGASADTTDQLVTMVTAYYRNGKGGIGRLRWVNDVVLEDLEDYQLRRVHRCTACGAVGDGKKCAYCGSKKFEDEVMEYEELTEDIVLRSGAVIPAVSTVRDELGQPVALEAGVLLPQMQPGGGPAVAMMEAAYRQEQTRIPYRRYGREGSVILCDLKEFFPSAPRRTLLDRHLRYMPEGPIRALADEMVLTAPETEPGRGMPLGMEQSQQEMVALPSAVDNWLRCQMHMEAQHYMDDYVILVPPGVDAAAVLEAFIARCEALGLRVNRRKCRYAPLRRPFRYCKTKFRLTETGRVVTHRTGDAQRRCRRKMRLLAARGDWEGVRAQIVSAKGYYKRHNDNGRLTALRALHSALRKERAA